MRQNNDLSESLLDSMKGDEDLKAMVRFFLEYCKLGHQISNSAAKAAVERKICTPMKMKLMVDKDALKCEDLGLDEFDWESVKTGLNSHEKRMASGTPLHPVAQMDRNTTAALQQPAREGHDDFFSPGFFFPLIGEDVCVKNCNICCLACLCPCIPAAAVKAQMEDRNASVFDCCFPPNLFQLRQQFRWKYLRGAGAEVPMESVASAGGHGGNQGREGPQADDFLMEDCFASCCCGFCGITQLILEIAKIRGDNPIYC